MLARLAIFLVALTPWAARGQDEPPLDPPPAPMPAPGEPSLRDLMHARNFAMGGAYRAHGLGAEAGYGNPATLAMYRRYQLELSGAWDVENKFAFGTVAVADSATSQLAAGVTYHLVSLGRGERQRTAHLNTLSFAVPLSQALHLGASGRHVLMSGARGANAITMDAGLLLRATESISVAVSGHNLIDVANPDLPRHYVLSLAFVPGLFVAAADLGAEWEGSTVHLSYKGGVEYYLGDAIPLRAGYAYDSVSNSHFVSGGLGFVTEGGGVDLAYRHQVGSSGGRMLALTLKLQVQ